MKLHSLEVRSFKIHDLRRVEFDHAITLLAGPNEAGKSTLLQALSAALFLRSKGDSKDHRALRSRIHIGHPEVELVFSSAGQTFTLKKCFSGNSGTSLLREHGGQTWSGDEVEEQLASILKVNGAKKFEGQWAHLLIQQGCSGSDPLIAAEAQSRNLVRRLQDEGGAAVLLSAKDQEVAAHFACLYEESFKKGDEPKAGSPLAQAMASERDAQARLQSARERHGKLLDAATSREEASEVINIKTADIGKLQPEFDGTKTKLAEAEKLENELRSLELEAKNRADEHGRLEAADKDIADTRAAEARLRDEIAPLTKSLAGAEKSLENAAAALSAKEKAYTDATSSDEAAALRDKLTRADQTALEKSKTVKDLDKVASGIRKRREELQELETKISGITYLDDEVLDKLTSFSDAATRAKAKLDATATRLRVISADAPVKVGADTVSAGDERTLTLQTELLVGNGTLISLTPGGESSAQEAKDEEEEAARLLRDAMRGCGVSSLADARKIVGEKAKLVTQRDSARQGLEELDADKIDAELTEARTELKQAENTLANLQKEDPGFARASSLAAAKKASAASEQAARGAATARTNADAARKEASLAQVNARDARDRIRGEITRLSQEADAKKAQLDLLLQQNGDDAHRAAKLAVALDQKTKAADAFQAAKIKLDALQIETLRRSVARLEGALQSARSSLQEAETTRAVALAKLQRDSQEDPEAALEKAEAQHENAGKALTVVRRTAEARKLLHRLFQDQKSELAREYTRPLIQKIGAYLQCVFGPRVRADLDLQGDKMAGIKISRDDLGEAAFDFDQLSGGTAEQVAAAARLAMAEVLAADYGGQLPVVFDDAFTNSDPERTVKLQDMLYLAATHGLQVIVLSCNPAAYTGSGAKEIHLPKRRFSHISKPNESENAPIREPEGSPSDSLPVPPIISPQTVTDEQTQHFLASLEAAGGKSGNIRLRETLGWNESLYESVKVALIRDGAIQPGQGRGGSVKLLGAV